MKKFIYTIAILLVGLGVLTRFIKPPIFGADATTMNAVIAKIKAYEDNELATKGDYTQIQWNGAIPDGTNPVTWDKSAVPLGKAKNWSGVSGLPATSDVAYTVDIYHGPKGNGYTITATYHDSLGDYHYFEHVGPESYRDFGADTWTSPTPLVIPDPTSIVATK